MLPDHEFQCFRFFTPHYFDMAKEHQLTFSPGLLYDVAVI
jgi:hypothetical protein